MFRDIFNQQNCLRGCYWHLQVVARDAVSPPTMHRTSLHSKELFSPKCNQCCGWKVDWKLWTYDRTCWFGVLRNVIWLSGLSNIMSLSLGLSFWPGHIFNRKSFPCCLKDKELAFNIPLSPIEREKKMGCLHSFCVWSYNPFGFYIVSTSSATCVTSSMTLCFTLFSELPFVRLR